MANRDMFRYREGRQESKVVQLWLKTYKKSVLVNGVLLCYAHNEEGKELEVEILRKNESAVEITADTVVGWLNSPIGRSFINEAFGTMIPLYGENGAEGK